MANDIKYVESLDIFKQLSFRNFSEKCSVISLFEYYMFYI